MCLYSYDFIMVWVCVSIHRTKIAFLGCTTLYLQIFLFEGVEKWLTQQSGALAAPLEDPDLIPSTHEEAHNPQ